jgi:hypothetical protein
MLRFEPLALPTEASDPAKSVGGYAHICSRKFIDYEFPPKSTSLEGDPPLLRPVQQRPPVNATVWAPASTIAEFSGSALFGLTSEPIGDWLDEISPDNGGLYPTFAAICEYPGQVEALFNMSPNVNSFGMYHIWLYDIWQSIWRRMTLDEYVPVVRGDEQGSAMPWGGGSGLMLWTLLLEKALAKLCGSFDALHRSEPGALLMALTGQQFGIRCWVRDGHWWARWRYLQPDFQKSSQSASSALANEPDTHRRVRGNTVLKCPVEREPGTWFQHDGFFSVAEGLHKENVLLFACKDPGVDPAGERSPCRLDPNGSGIVNGAGYSLLQLVESEEHGLKLVQLRNIWGPRMQWTGAWSAQSTEWEMLPEVRRRYRRQEHEGSGRFWMSWEDFCSVFDRVYICPMPGAARKASYVPQAATRTRRRPWGHRARAAEGRPNRQQGCGGGYFFQCCSVERAKN